MLFFLLLLCTFLCLLMYIFLAHSKSQFHVFFKCHPPLISFLYIFSSHSEMHRALGKSFEGCRQQSICSWIWHCWHCRPFSPNKIAAYLWILGHGDADASDFMNDVLAQVSFHLLCGILISFHDVWYSIQSFNCNSSSTVY